MRILTEREIPEIRAVLFDMDGLLIDSEPLGQAALKETCRQLGYQVDDQFGLSLLGKTEEANMQRFREKVPGFDVSAYQKLFGRLLHELFRTDLKPKRGAEVLLDWLDDRKIPYALASSSGMKRVQYSLECSGLESRFAVRLTGEAAVHSKPDPDLFLSAALALKVSPRNCLVLEDSENGIRAGRAAGAVVCMIPDLIPYSDKLQEFCDFVGESLLEIPKLLEELGNNTL